ncbi:LOW QUALITY PROTEIN: nck-associated protein 5-like [Phycodurus eques]|uniref:LOW QUALITY PROTEIN: nck-associated protein 5-like n=1 Tax=Phycodurus eques TaxID=693459 RepID=UPI002ACEF267|nr:LOW QUALITY PROTEIN: nck-associated protein 5-like [Phycodurus eques]
MVTLQQHFSRMEETVQTLLQNQDSLDGPKVDPLDLMKAYKDKLLEEMWKQQDSLEGSAVSETETSGYLEAGGGLEENSNSNSLLERLKALEAENSALSLENDNQRKQYERCLDEVANQVVQALLTQKDLKEECVKLRTRVFDLEQQNRLLSVLFQQRVRMSQSPAPQEIQRNGKVGIAAGRWPSLLSLTCPRSSGSGSDLSLSSAGSEYSSGSHTWAEGRGLSKQCATSRDKRMSVGSVSGHQTDFGWKEGHILKGLKRLQTSVSKEKPSPGSIPHCKDCMISNEGIYSLGIKSNLIGMTAKTNKNVNGGIAVVDSDESSNDSNMSQSQESSDNASIEVQTDDGPKESLENTCSDSFIFPAEPPVNLEKESLKEHIQVETENSSDMLSDSNNNQERSSDRKSRLDRMDLESQARDANPAVRHSATRALSCVSEARQRSSSAEVSHHGDGGISRNLKPKPQLCDSARKAFILRSKSADAGPEQHKHIHSPLHQNLIRGHKSASPNKRANHGKLHVSGHDAETDEDPASTCKSLERVQQRSPLASPVKSASVTKPIAVDEGSKTPATQPQSARILSNNEECKNVQHQEQLSDTFSSELISPSAPLLPGRTTSLLLRTASDSRRMSRPQSATVGKTTSGQQTNFSPENQAGKVVFNGHSSRMPAVPSPETQGSESPVERTVAYHSGMVAPSLLPNPNVLQRSQQSISEPKLSEVLSQTYSNVYYHNCQSSGSKAVKMCLPANARSHEAISGPESGTFLVFSRQNKDDANPSMKNIQTYQTYICDPHMMRECGIARRKIETRCNSLDSEPCGAPVTSDGGAMLDWGFDEEGWLFKRSVSVSTRPPLKPVMGMNGAKARSQSFGARYMDRPSFNRSGKVRTQIKTHSGSSLNSLGDILPGSMSCSSSYHCPMNRSLLNNFLIEEGLAVPPCLGSSSERLQSLKVQREQARRLQIEQQFSSAFGEPVCEEPERQSTITTIEEKVMLGIEENLHKSQEQERSSEVKQKSGSTLANWFGFRKGKLPIPSGKKTDPAKTKEEKRDQKITALLGGKQTKTDKKRDRRKNDGKDCSVGRRESHDAVRACISMPCPGISIQGHNDITGDAQRTDGENGALIKTTLQDAVIGSGCKMRTLDSGIGTIPLPESCSFFSSILHLLPKSSSSTPEPESSLSSVLDSSCEEVSPLPRWRIPSGFRDNRAGVPNSLSDVTHIQSVPFPTVAFLQPVRPQPEPIVTSAHVCDSHNRTQRPPQGGIEPKKLTYIKTKTRTPQSQQKEQTRLQVAN